MSEIIKISILVFLGLVFGSFINAWVWRLSQTLDTDGNTKKLPVKKQKELSILTGRSMCPSCKHVLVAKDLVPVFSWVFLKGKCRYCKAKISPQYPAVELLTAVLFVISGAAWNFNNTLDYVSFACWLGVLTGFVALAVYDIKYMLLPDKILKIIFPLAVIIAVIGVINSNSSLAYIILQLLLAVFVAGGLFYILYVLSAGAWIGGGDVKLALVLGLVLSTALMSVLMLFIASILGVIASIIINRGFQKKAKIPFGPFLIVGTYITVLYGGGILDWYINLLTYGL
jgi:prepilin signal peptidase PulO-like enzyme (type II secretory pathway)